MANVYAWPPVGAIAREWTVDAPVSISRSLITGAEYVSAAQRRRRKAVIEVSSLFSLEGSGAGFMEVLKRLLDGGINLVRLTSHPINGHCGANEDEAWRMRDLDWLANADDLSWVAGGWPIKWVAATEFSAAPGVDGISAFLTVSGLPPNTLVARPGEFVSVISETAMVMTAAWSDDSGVAIIRLLTPISSAGPAEIGASETGVFKADEMPRAVQPATGDWSYTWNFTEVFEDEGRGPFMEINPWI